MQKRCLILAIVLILSTMTLVTSDENTYLNMADVYVDDDADPSWYDETHVATIAEAISNASAGQSIYIYNGTYAEGQMDIDKDGLSFIGESRDSVIINGGFSTLGQDDLSFSTMQLRDWDGGDGLSIDDGTYNVTIENIYFTNFSNGAGDSIQMSGGGGGGCHNVTIDNCEFYGDNGHGILITDVDDTDVTISNCTFDITNDKDAILALGNHLTIEHNTINTNRTAIIGGMAGEFSENVTIRNNDITMTATGYAGIVKYWGGKNWIIENNELNDCGGSGIVCEGGSIQIINNNITSITTDNGCGIDFYSYFSADDVLIEGNDISGPFSLSICCGYAHNLTIRNNKIHGAFDAGVFKCQNSDYLDVNISDNEIYNCSRAIHIDGLSEPYPDCDIEIYNNTIHNIGLLATGGSHDNWHSIWLMRANNITVDSNTIYDGGNCQIYCDRITNITVKNNLIYRGFSDGISIDGCNNMDVYGNEIWGSAWAIFDYGTWMGNPDSTDVHIYDNYLHDNVGIALSIRSDNFLVENNTFIDNKRDVEVERGSSTIQYNTIINHNKPGWIGTSNILAYEIVDPSEATWLHNYYSDYVGVDDGDDGFGDTSYCFYGNSDSSPLIGIYPFGACFQYSLNNLEITLNATSYDYNGGGITNYTWDLGDGTTAYTKDVVHEYPRAGLYTVTLTVHNSTTSDSDSFDIYVGTPPTTMYVDDDYHSGTDGWKYDHWDSVQDAVYYIENGTVNIASGTYIETIYIYNKSVNLIGDDATTTIIDANNNATALNTYFGLQMIGSTLWLNSVYDSEITGLTLMNCSYGGNRAGITLSDYKDEVPDGGTRLLSTSSMNIDIHDNILKDNRNWGMIIGYLRDGDVYNNTIFDCSFGMGLFSDATSVNATIHNNEIYNIDGYGICVEGDGEYYENYVHDCDYGIYSSPYSGIGAVIHRNNIVSCVSNIVYSGNAVWMGGVPIIGNYYDDYGGIDANADGIGDSAYGNDPRPLMVEYNGTDPVCPPIHNINKDTYDVLFQTAINDADEGDTIEVGWYEYMSQGDDNFGEENIIIDKKLNLIGLDRDNIIIYGNGDNALTILEDNVYISNITITDAKLITDIDPNDYCSHGGTSDYFIISNVQFADLDHSSPVDQSDGGYADNTNLRANLTAGETYTLNVTVNDLLDGGYPIYVSAFIDWGADFTEYRVGQTATDSGGATVSTSIEVPNDFGGSAMMRVMVKYNGWATACEELLYGEVEDYEVYAPVVSIPAGININADNVSIIKCNITGNSIGIKSVSSIIASYNNLWDNDINANDSGISQYKYNYWDTYDEPDEGAWDNNTDGIADDPYPIEGGNNKDLFPLMNPWGGTLYNLAPLQPTTVYPNNIEYLSVHDRYALVHVIDPDNDNMTVSFYWDNDTVIGIDSVSNDTDAQVWMPNPLEHDTTYYWYAKIFDGIETTNTSLYRFHTSMSWDINEDAIVNYLDVSSLISEYNNICSPGVLPQDINNDGIVNYLDVSSLVAHYGEK